MRGWSKPAVASGLSWPGADPADAAMAAAARAYVQAARAVGLGKQEALRYVDAAFG